ncbi:unnamed protein product [Cyprideis torosa]|uniref:Uncharacterized protein n=1 Tax=Cyprideis torosa TaxID=163714 RepID=A0A7R8ZI74_9CRUS|nr:unnamed protein product [Cyprideis torosa]CAG0885426.1 unnamed protein product [Cyprideis torosa]
MYRMKAEDFHRPKRRIRPSSHPCSAAQDAPPIRREWKAYDPVRMKSFGIDAICDVGTDDFGGILHNWDIGAQRCTLVVLSYILLGQRSFGRDVVFLLELFIGSDAEVRSANPARDVTNAYERSVIAEKQNRDDGGKKPHCAKQQCSVPFESAMATLLHPTAGPVSLKSRHSHHLAELVHMWERVLPSPLNCRTLLFTKDVRAVDFIPKHGDDVSTESDGNDEWEINFPTDKGDERRVKFEVNAMLDCQERKLEISPGVNQRRKWRPGNNVSEGVVKSIRIESGDAVDENAWGAVSTEKLLNGKSRPMFPVRMREKRSISEMEKKTAGVCDFCGIYYRRVIEHRRIHTHEKPWKCDQCDQSYAAKDSLYRHKRSHSEDLGFVCAECGYSSRYGSQFKRHMERHHNIKRYKCFACQRPFESSWKVKKHMSVHSGRCDYQCVEPNCSAKFNRKAARDDHWKVVHNHQTHAYNLATRITRKAMQKNTKELMDARKGERLRGRGLEMSATAEETWDRGSLEEGIAAELAGAIKVILLAELSDEQIQKLIEPGRLQRMLGVLVSVVHRIADVEQEVLDKDKLWFDETLVLEESMYVKEEMETEEYMEKKPKVNELDPNVAEEPPNQTEGEPNFSHALAEEEWPCEKLIVQCDDDVLEESERSLGENGENDPLMQRARRKSSRKTQSPMGKSVCKAPAPARGRTITGIEKYTDGICDICGVYYRRVLEHRRIHTLEKPYICPQPHCGQAYAAKDSLARHIRCIHGERNHMCSECGYVTAYSWQFQRHMDRHKDIRKYKCPICARGFDQKFRVSQHLKVHKGITSFNCDECPASFNMKKALQDHQSVVHFKQPHTISLAKLYMGDRVMTRLNERNGQTVKPMERLPRQGKIKVKKKCIWQQ